MQRPGLDLDAVDADGCTPIWAAAYNGEYHCALWILSKGPNLELRGKASNTASCTPCNAARSQRNPTIADAIDAELELRRQDPKRVGDRWIPLGACRVAGRARRRVRRLAPQF